MTRLVTTNYVNLKTASFPILCVLNSKHRSSFNGYISAPDINTHTYIYMCVIYICHQCVSLCREADTCKYESWCRIKQHSMGFFKPVSNLSIQYTAWGKLTWMWNTHCFPGKMICKWRGFHIYVGLRKIIKKKTSYGCLLGFVKMENHQSHGFQY